MVGERRSGKTSVLKVLMHPDVRAKAGLDEQYIFAFLDCSVVDQDADEQGVWRYLLKQVAFYLPEELQNRFWETVDSDRPLTNLQVMQLFTHLQRAKIKLVLLLDEFDALTRNEGIGVDFYASLRSLSLHHPLALVTASYADLTQTTTVEAVRTSPFFNIFHTIYLRLLTENDALDLLQGSLRSAQYFFSPEEIANLLCWAGPHPFYLKLAAHSLYEAYANGESSAEARWRSMEESFYDQAQPHFLRLWRFSSEDERLILSALALAISPDGLAEKRLVRHGYNEETLQDMHHFARRTLRNLERRCLAVANEQKETHLFAQAFGVWLIEELQASLSEKQQFSAWLARAEDDLELLTAVRQLDEMTLQSLAYVKPVYRPLMATWLAIPQMREGVFLWAQSENSVGTLPKNNQAYLIYLRKLMEAYVTEAELRTICFDLGIDYEGLEVGNKNVKAHALLKYFHKLDQISVLADACRELYPHVDWSGTGDSAG